MYSNALEITTTKTSTVKKRNLSQLSNDGTQHGQVEKAEVRKPKYGSEKNNRLLMSSALLTHVKAL